MLEETNPCYKSQEHRSEEIPQHVSLNASALHSFDCDRSPLGNFGKSVHRGIDDMAVKPCDALADYVEDNLVSDEHIDFIPIDLRFAAFQRVGIAFFIAAGLLFFFI